MAKTYSASINDTKVSIDVAGEVFNGADIGFFDVVATSIVKRITEVVAAMPLVTPRVRLDWLRVVDRKLATLTFDAAFAESAQRLNS